MKQDSNQTTAKRPLHGVKTHPLSEAALHTLSELRDAYIPAQEINPGLLNRLDRGGLVDYSDRPSPYKTRKGMVSHVTISDQGIDVLTEGRVGTNGK